MRLNILHWTIVGSVAAVIGSSVVLVDFLDDRSSGTEITLPETYPLPENHNNFNSLSLEIRFRPERSLKGFLKTIDKIGDSELPEALDVFAGDWIPTQGWKVTAASSLQSYNQQQWLIEINSPKKDFRVFLIFDEKPQFVHKNSTHKIGGQISQINYDIGAGTDLLVFISEGYII